MRDAGPSLRAVPPSLRPPSPPRPRRLPGRALLTGFALTVLALQAGCGIGEKDLARWKEVKEGQERLTGYMAAADRPLELRVRAARYLFEIGAGGQIVLVLRGAPAAERKALLEPFLVHLGKQFASETPDEPLRAKDLFYSLLPLLKDADREFAEGAVRAFVEWSLGQLAPGTPTVGRPVDQVLVASGLEFPEATSEALLAALQAEKDPARVQRLSGLIDTIGHVPARLKAARILLDKARAALPEPPEALLQAIGANGNETLMRFLLDAARDPTVPLMTRGMCIDLAVAHLGKGALPGLTELLGSEDPVTHNALRGPALLQLHRLRGPKHVDETLAALPDGVGWPDEGDAFKVAILKFCDDGLSAQKNKVRKGLLAALSGENRTARIFAATCVRRLYGEEAGELLGALKADKTPLLGFGRDPPPTLGDLARGKLED